MKFTLATGWPKAMMLGSLGVAGLALISGFTFWAILPIWDSISRAETQAELARHYRSLMAEKPTYEAALTRAKSYLASETAFFAEPSPELASAQLQNTMQVLAADAGGQVQSSAIEASKMAHGVQIISVSLILTLPPSRLPSFLESIETQKPYLVVSDIDIRSTDMGTQLGPLDIQIQVNGFEKVP